MSKPTTKRTIKRRRCLWCRKPITGRADKQFCCAACRKSAERHEAATDQLRHTTRLKNASLATELSPLERLHQSEFIQWFLQQLARHGSIDCLGDNFSIEDHWQLYCTRGRLAFMTKTAIDISHLIPCNAGGSFDMGNLTLLPAKVNRAQGARFLPPTGVGKTFRLTHPRVTDHQKLWSMLVRRYRKQFTTFALAHKTMKGNDRIDAIEQVISTPGAPYVYRDTLQSMDEQRFKTLCDSLNIAYKARKTASTDTGNGDWPVSRICTVHLYRIRHQLPEHLYQQCVMLLRLMSFPGVDMDENDLRNAYNYNFEPVVSRLTNRVMLETGMNREELLMNLESANLDNLFITANLDGSHTSVLVVGTDEGEEPINPEMQAALDEAALNNHKIALNNCKIARARAKVQGISPQAVIESIPWTNLYRKAHALDYLNRGVDLQ